MRYRLPRRYIRFHQKPVCVGQKQRWFVLRLMSGERQVDLTKASEPEFDHWRWIAYWDALEDVVDFKRAVYSRALNELAPAARQCTNGMVPANPPT